MPVVGEPIAIIGTGCRFPGHTNTPSKLWQLLCEPCDLLEPVTKQFAAEGWYHKNGKYHGHCNVKQSYQLAGDHVHRRFDAQFFGINAVEASTIDPQMRLLLETVYEALEAAGQPIESLRGSHTAVYTGMMTNSYKIAMERDLESMGMYHVSGTSRAMMSNRLSYFFDWHGPSMTIDTACSSSLIAIHQAILQLRTGQSRIAVAAGSNLLLDPSDYVSMSKLEMLSPDSRSRMWDKDANGYARGEGVAAVILKTLRSAEADGDHIECIIRETATNQDGRTPGITMPSATAQTQLIQDCYARAGLDTTIPSERPQYFEAHGTGTPAGDPIEAEAIATAFFPNDGVEQCNSDPLLVGGIKTVIGHSESVAGLAGVIKVSLALQNAIVPPNLLFSEISPKVEPFYQHLRIPTSAVPWPMVQDGAPRRASVNSFGFGGSNAHAILESYTPKKQPADTKTAVFVPFVFSAVSKTSLSLNLASLADHIRGNGAHMNLRDLAMTLHSRRSRLPLGVSITAGTAHELCQKLEESSQNIGHSTEQPMATQLIARLSNDHNERPKVLGIFTGQGTQSARMGAALIEQSKSCERIIDKLEARLTKLPKADRPSWSLKEELLKDCATGIHQAVLSQPLCTALQILQVDLLHVAGVEFSAVIGHSSGEIAAAYCAGMISAEDAICIAYYRGLHSNLAVGCNGKGGAMLAVGTSFEDAHALCSEEEFHGRVSVAAVNSSASVTLSGDEDAVDEIKLIFEDEGKFCRRLKVDKAYHSSHMAPCSSMYLRALRGLEIQPREAKTRWFSSVDGGKPMASEDYSRLQATYWNDNMIKPVMFMQAVEEAWNIQEQFALSVEIGPHPALRGPVLQTIQDLSMQEIPYTGIHTREQNAVESMANALGFIWAHLGAVDLPRYDKFVTGHSNYNFVTGLPAYAWDHEKEYWHESRYAKAVRSRSEPVNELLGHLTPDSTDQDMRWRNILCPKELSWLKDHALQQQAVFPAAGYVVAAAEAAAAITRARKLPISLIEVLDLDIGKALAFDSDDSRIEIITSVTDIQQDGNRIEASFKFNAAPTFQATAPTLHASCHIRIALGIGDEGILPTRERPNIGLSKVEAIDFYESLSGLEYQYTGPFRALSHLERKLGFATGHIANEPSRLIIHPATLDAAFQSLLLAHCAPNSGGIWSLHVPRSIQAIRINPLLCAANMTQAVPLKFDCSQTPELRNLEGDIDLVSDFGGTQHTMVQIEALTCVAFSQPTSKDDKLLFSTTVWDVATPTAEQAAYDSELPEQKVDLARLLERMSVYYLRRLDTDVPRDHPARRAGPFQQYFLFAAHILSRAKEGGLPLWSSQWEFDSFNDLARACKPYSHVADIKLLKAIGDNIVDIATEQTQAIEVAMKDDMLPQIYQQGLGFEEYTRFLARLVKQIVHRYPQMNILEIGAGTGGATKEIFREIGHSFSSYTYTDVSSGFFESSQRAFAPQHHKMIYKVLDISKDVKQQGYNEHSYDLIVAFAVLHATPTLQDTLKNVRHLLKAGGFLVVLELHPVDVARIGTMFGALPGWWLSADAGRTMSPCVNIADWDRLLRATGFSGCDTVTPVRNSLVTPMSVFVSQAVDDRVEFLRNPLSTPISLFKDNAATPQDVILLGGSSSLTKRPMAELKSLLSRQWDTNIRIARSLTDIASLTITSGTTVLSLLEIDKPVFKDLNSSDWEALKSLLQEAGTILWVSSGRRTSNPYASMMVGLLRSARQEIPTLDYQCFDTGTDKSLDVHELAETLLRLKATAMWQRQDAEGSLLITVEPELVREQNAAPVIPRLIAHQEMNDRYNSSRRVIFAPVGSNVSNANIGITGSVQGNVHLHEALETERRTGPPIRVTHSSLSAIRVSEFGSAYLVLGHSSDLDQQVVALTSQNTLMVAPLASHSIPVIVPPGHEAAFVAILAHHLIAHVFFEGLSRGESVIVHEPDKMFADTLRHEAVRRGIQAVFTTTSMTTPVSGMIKIHPMSPERVVRASIPMNAAALFTLSAENRTQSLGARLRALLPSNCRYHNLDTAFTGFSCWKLQDRELPNVQSRLKECVLRISEQLDNLRFPVPIVRLDKLAEPKRQAPQTIVDWTLPITSTHSVQVSPADTYVRFSNCRTYWLAGLSGSLGLLLCEWMVRHGAKYIVISSRTPRVDEAWLEKMRISDAVVKVFSCDITDKTAVSELYKNIKSSMPPISGVCQGAMVLQDISIRDMSLEDMLTVTRPKVEGSLHLDQLFTLQDSDLDFFIFFSSAGSLIGRAGQGNYAAANLFITALAEQRRLRGQVASVMHIGPIFGVGYITQHGLDTPSKLPATMKSMFPISERDFCQHFAEAVIAGRSKSRPPVLEVTTGLAKFESLQEAGPLLSHYTQDQFGIATEELATRSAIPLASQLAAAQEGSQVMRIIREALLLKLSALFQITLSKLEESDLTALRLDEMGIDSLIAVELRSWFYKTLQVNIPVLKMLSGAAVADLIKTAMETLPRQLVPMLDVEGLGPQAIVRDDTMQESVMPPIQQMLEDESQSFSNVLRREQKPEDPVPKEEPLSSMEDNESPNGQTSNLAQKVAAEASNSEAPVDRTATPSDEAIGQRLYSESHSTPITTPQSQDDEPMQGCKTAMPSSEAFFKLSFSQSLFWFSATSSDNPSNLNLTATFRFTTDIDIERLRNAVVALGHQHESLRTRFVVRNGQPMQGVMSSTALSLEHYTIQHESELATYTNKIHNHVYDLESGKMIRLAVVSLSRNCHFFIIGVHHLAMDGQSFFPLMSDMLQHYTNRHQGMTAVQYVDFSEKQHREVASGGFKEEMTFWKTELAEMPSPLPILRTSSLTSRPVLQAYGNRHVDVRIGKDTKTLIQALCRRCRATPFHFYLAVFRVLLCRYTGSEYFSVGIGDANRTEEDLMGSIGDFVNILPLVFHTSASLHFDTVLQETRSKTLAALAHSRLPFQVLLNELGVQRSASTTPVFQAFMDYRLAKGEKMSWGDFKLELLSFQPSKLAYDIAIDVIDNSDGDCRLTLIVRDDIYSQQDAQQLAESYVLLAGAFSSQPETTLGEAAMFPKPQIDEALNLGRGPLYQSRQWGSTVIDRVDSMAKRHPSRTAVITGDGGVASYDEVVHRKVDVITTELEAVGITTGSRVAVLQEPTADWVSSILAVMRIGAIYLPLDLGIPWSRLAAIVKDCQPAAVLVDDQTISHVHKLGCEGTNVVSISNKHRGHRHPNSATPESISTILYTSGSSGTPKGIVLTHQGMRSWLEPCEILYGMRRMGEVILQQSSQGFDMSLMQIFTALCFGGTVCLLPRKFRGDARVISETIARHSITHTYGTPSEYLSWLRYGDPEALRNSSWKTALVGGEPLATFVLKEFAALGKGDLRFHHMYGTTESTFCAAVMELDYVKRISDEELLTLPPKYPAGVALPNYNIYILDEQRRPLPVGIQGEIFIGGAGVALEYLNNPSLTRETFVTDPFITSDDRIRGWNMMQRTGDLGRWSRIDHGAILIEGRISGDTMVKLRGLRVDLREVEIAILHAGAGFLSEAIVSVRRNSPEAPEFLVAHVVFEQQFLRREDGHEHHLRQVRERIELLPLYMRPAFIVPLDALPMTASGKLDRKAISILPLATDVSDTKDVTWTLTEERLKVVWDDVLSHEHTDGHEITPETDFFHVGGTSLTLLRLRDKIKTEFDLDFPLLDLFEASVLSSMARRIEGQIDVLEVIDWDEETRLRPSMANLDSGKLQQVPNSQSKVVILTGGSGYLGKALINAMIKDPTVSEIHCLGVRNVATRTDLKALHKVTLYEGDLCQPRIGLPQSIIDDLFSRADVIIHNGADISYMKTYQTMRQSNFLTTKDLVEWSMPRMIPFHYISTAGVGSFAPGSCLQETSVASTPPPTNGSMGYTACKWASERFLEKLVEKHRDWPVCVHRPTLISRDDVPQLDGMHNILGYARKLRAVPISHGVARGVVNVVGLEAVVAGVLNSALRRNERDEHGWPDRHRRRGEVHFVNHTGNLDLPLNNMRKWALQRAADGYVEFAADVDFVEIPMDDWIRRAGELGMHPTMGALLASFAHNGEVEFPTVAKGAR